jgi:benzoylformate decarboxylase
MRVFVLTADPAEAHRSPAELAVVGDPGVLCSALAAAVAESGREAPAPLPASPYRLDAPTDGALRAAHVFQLLAERLPAEATIVEESPSSRPALEALIPARRPLGFLSAAMGGLGFALPAAIGLRLARPEHPVVAVVGDGSSLYSVQALWTAATLGIGVAVIVLNNDGYAVMNRLAEQRGGEPAWPPFGSLSLATIGKGFGVESVVVDEHAELARRLDELVPSLGSRTTPLLLEVRVQPDATFAP